MGKQKTASGAVLVVELYGQVRLPEWVGLVWQDGLPRRGGSHFFIF